MTVLVITGLGAAIVVAVGAYVVRWCWLKGPYVRAAVVLLLGAGFYHLVRGIHPPEAFYREEFANHTGIAMPATAKVRFSRASFPDFHGDYSSAVLFEVSPADYEWLLQAAKLTAPDDGGLGGPFLRDAEAAFGKKMECRVSGGIRKRAADAYGGWTLLSDGRSVYFWFSQT